MPVVPLLQCALLEPVLVALFCSATLFHLVKHIQVMPPPVCQLVEHELFQVD